MYPSDIEESFETFHLKCLLHEEIIKGIYELILIIFLNMNFELLRSVLVVGYLLFSTAGMTS